MEQVLPSNKQSQQSEAGLWGFAPPYHYAFEADNGTFTLHLMVEGMKCAGCMRSVEKALSVFPELDEARVNLSTHRLVIRWSDAKYDPLPALEAVMAKGFRLAPYDPAKLGDEGKREEKQLLIALGVAGFAAANVMMLSFAVWAGEGEMAASTRALFYWMSALVALPVIAYSGRPFFSSALSALSAKRLNMDVPISLAVLLAAGMSLYETASFGEHAYFDAAVSLLFFLLIGRYLDRRARAKARSAGAQLLGLQASAATVEDDGGSISTIPMHLVEAGMIVLVTPGERVPVDGEVISGTSDVDASLVSGESLPQNVQAGDLVFAGTTNLAQPLRLKVSAVGEETLLGEIARLMETAEQGRGAFVQLADRVASIYAPVVHLLGLLTFLAWWGFMGAAWQDALLYAIAVLIITCPCALALAVPAVQVVASGRLLRAGILLKSADALERIKGVDTVVFDKTGTLTTGALRVAGDCPLSDGDLAIASGMAASSRHPLAKALRSLAPDAPRIEGVEEVPGQGLKADVDGREVRLGSAQWCGADADLQGGRPVLWLQQGEKRAMIEFEDQLREDAAEVIAQLDQAGLDTVLLSGDHQGSVSAVAKLCGIKQAHHSLKPQDKVAWITSHRDAGHRVLMVGDGLNDAPALTAADASISPSTAADISQVAADIIFQGTRLSPVIEAMHVAKKSDQLVKMNFGMAFTYNAVAIPLAVVGLATPLVAAIAMSTSSILVILNALRLKRS